MFPERVLMNMKTIKEIEAELSLVTNLNDPLLQEYTNDPRSGVVKIVNQRIKSIQKLHKLINSHKERQIYENNLFERGYQWIAGVDEVGRGPLAGPLVTAAVILPKNKDHLMGINDSKQLSAKKRAEFVKVIKEEAITYSISVFDNRKVDQFNIYKATQLSMLESINGLSILPDYLLIDAMSLETDIAQLSIIKGDQKSISIAAASILAKEYRDALMIEYSKEYPYYGFEHNMGYGTPEHLNGLEQYGYCDIHRQSFEPIKTMAKKF